MLLMHSFNIFIILSIFTINHNWGLGIGDWGLGIGPNPQCPIPNPQAPRINNLYCENR